MRGHGSNRDDDENCKELLKLCEMFFKVSDQHLSAISKLMKYKVFQRNQVMLTQGAPSDRFFLLDTGEIRRLYESGDGKVHNVEYAIKAKSIGSMKVLSMDPVFATVKCVSDECRVFELLRSDLVRLMKREPDIATEIAIGLCETVRTGTRKYQTPLLEQQQQEINIPAVAIAAGIESYYRSALNSLLNASLTGVKSDLFPNMHIQVPTRM
jgi:CRP-like cAMP-binding protein